MVLAAAFTEGTANDWMAVAFVDGHHVAQALGVIALAVFLSFMTIGRILGTRLLDRYGRVLVLRTLFGAAIVGCALVVFGHLWLAFAGAALWVSGPASDSLSACRPQPMTPAGPRYGSAWSPPSATPRSSAARRCWVSSAITSVSCTP